MTSTLSLLDWIMSLLEDKDARAQFQADPGGYTARSGFTELSGADVHDALCLAADRAPAHSDHATHLPSPSHHHGESGHRYLDHYINHYETIEKHDTFLDNSVHQDIDTGGGDFDQHLDNDPVVASGDGAVAAHGDIRDATLTSGHGNVVGNDDHAVTGDGGSTAFGSGAANSADLGHSSLGDGGSLSIGGAADGHNTASDTTTAVHGSGSGSTSVNASGPEGHANSYADQHEQDSSRHSHYDNDSSTDHHDTLNSGNSGHYEDSHDYSNHTFH
jgi:hypothetical protein